MPFSPTWHKKLPASRFQIIFAEKMQKEVKDDLVQVIVKNNPDVVFLGSFGRKTDKDDIGRIGSTLKNVAMSVSTPVVIAKQLCRRSELPTKGYSFAVCWDGNVPTVLSAVKMLATNKNDKVYGVHVNVKPNNLSKVETLWNEETQRMGISSELVVIEKDTSSVDTLLDKYINYNEKLLFDFTVLGFHKEMRKNSTLSGSTLFLLMNKAMTNLVLVAKQ